MATKSQEFFKKFYDLIIKYMQDDTWIEYTYTDELAGRFDIIAQEVYDDVSYYWVIPFFIHQDNFWDMSFADYKILLPTREAIDSALEEFDNFWENLIEIQAVENS